jgi:hypothetical protein
MRARARALKPVFGLRENAIQQGWRFAASPHALTSFRVAGRGRGASARACDPALRAHAPRRAPSPLPPAELQLYHYPRR